MTNGLHKADDVATAATTRRRRDRGATFIEILVSVVLLGTTGVAVLTATAATVRGSAVHDRVATAQAQLADAGDILSDVTYAGGDPYYDDCAQPSDYNDLLDPDPLIGAWPTQAASWPDVTVIDVQYWTPVGWDATSSLGCIGGEMQRITLQATVDGDTRELMVVKRQATQAVGVSGSAWDDDMVTPDPNPGF